MSGSVPLYDQTLHYIGQEYPLLGHALTRHRSLRGEALSFRDRPSLVELYTTLPKMPAAAIVKAPQTGVSELLIQMALYEAGEQGRIVGYVLPIHSIRDRFVARRINPLLRDIPAYRRRLPGVEQDALQSGDTGNLRSKAFGAGLILFLGAGTDGDFIEFSADTLILDEYDHCLEASADNMGKARDRVMESKSPRIIQLGNPEVPRGGIELLYDEGDRRAFHWTCSHCGHRQPIDWLANVVERLDNGQWSPRDPAARKDPEAPVRPVCTRCHEPFVRDPDHAAWIAMSPGPGRIPSYRMTRWDDMRTDLRALVTDWGKVQASSRALRLWWRGFAGRAFEDSTNAILREDLIDASCLEPIDYRGGDEYKGAVTAGIDVGNVINVIISRTVRPVGRRVERQCRFIGTVTTPEQLLDLLKRYHVRNAVIDANPERRMSQQVREKAATFGCTVWLCEFIGGLSRAGTEEFGMRLDPAGRVVVDRTQLLDASADAIRAGAGVARALRHGAEKFDVGMDGARLWPKDAVDTSGWEDQMRAPTRILNEKGHIIWDEAGKPDHYRLTDAYDHLAWTLDSQSATFR